MMQECAITYGVVAWLACWLVDLTTIVARSLAIEPVLKLVIVLLCLAIVLASLNRNRWLLFP